jgi:CubicO group peptidase (beta-lactamase class C family)
MLLDQILGPESLAGKALRAPSGVFTGPEEAGNVIGADGFNNAEVLAAEVPAANGVCTARSLAKMYAATIGEVDGVRILPETQRAAATEVQTSGPDKVLFFESRFGLGFMLSSPFTPMGGPRGFGHYGAGGSVGYADPDAALAFGFVMNQMTPNLVGDPRTAALTKAAYDAVGATTPG